MAEKKRWIAMYTKHIKQKRKVYHDGFLDFQITRRKNTRRRSGTLSAQLEVMLYDEGDNLLESRMLKADEVVSSGETIAFQAFLVDICDPLEGNKASSDPTVQPSGQGCERKSFAVLRPTFKKSSLHCGEKKPNLGNNFSSKSLSPSHKMIRVFKKRELHKYGALSPDTAKPTAKGTVPLGSADKESSNQPLINSPFNDSTLENDKLSKKDNPPRKPLRDVNQILSILQRRNVTETCSDKKPQTSVSLTKVPPESDTSKNHKLESVSAKAAAFREQCMEQETSSDSTSGRLMAHYLSDPPSFDLGI